MTDRGIERLTEELREWTQRPTSLPAAAARTRVLAQLERRPERPTWRLAVGGATLAASALALVLLVPRSQDPAVSVPPPAAAPPSQQMPSQQMPSQQMIVHQLSSGTKLYIVVEPSATSNEC